MPRAIVDRSLPVDLDASRPGLDYRTRVYRAAGFIVPGLRPFVPWFPSPATRFTIRVLPDNPVLGDRGRAPVGRICRFVHHGYGGLDSVYRHPGQNCPKHTVWHPDQVRPAPVVRYVVYVFNDQTGAL